MRRPQPGQLRHEIYYGNKFPPYSKAAALVSAVNTAIASGNRATIIKLATVLDGWNNGDHAAL